MSEWVSESVSCESGYWKFEKWKVKWKSCSLISRSEKWNENQFYSFREWKVKWKCLKIEIKNEKWNKNASRSRSRSEISREFSRNSWESRNWEIEKLRNFGPNDFHLVNFYFYQKCEFVMTKYEVTCTISLFFLEKKSEIWNAFTLFENWKVNFVFLSLISRMNEWMKSGDKKKQKLEGIFVTRIGDIFVT